MLRTAGKSRSCRHQGRDKVVRELCTTPQGTSSWLNDPTFSNAIRINVENLSHGQVRFSTGQRHACTAGFRVR
eukprot:scaffold307822_cov42-Prasinocladus_malaysianus.AAC.2